MRYILAFLSLVALDFVWTIYTKMTVAAAPVRAGVAAMAIIALSGLNAILYVGDHWTIPFAMAGAFVGTYLGVKQ